MEPVYPCSVRAWSNNKTLLKARNPLIHLAAVFIKSHSPGENLKRKRLMPLIVFPLHDLVKT